MAAITSSTASSERSYKNAGAVVGPIQHSHVNAIKFYFEKVLGRPWMVYDVRARKAETLPGFFSLDEVGRLFKAVANLKHRSILMTIYSAGLRVIGAWQSEDHPDLQTYYQEGVG